MAPIRTVACLLLVGTMAACERASNSPTAPTPASPAAPSASAATPAWILAELPADALGVAEVKATAREGDRVVIRGRIGGRAEPIGDGSPVLVMMDSSIPSCADNPDDQCATPWDYCCETPETLAANNATVQVVDGAGAPVADSLTEAGLAPLAEIVVVGIVGPRPEPSVLTIRATGVYRVMP